MFPEHKLQRETTLQLVILSQINRMEIPPTPMQFSQCSVFSFRNIVRGHRVFPSFTNIIDAVLSQNFISRIVRSQFQYLKSSKLSSFQRIISLAVFFLFQNLSKSSKIHNETVSCRPSIISQLLLLQSSQIERIHIFFVISSKTQKMEQKIIYV